MRSRKLNFILVVTVASLFFLAGCATERELQDRLAANPEDIQTLAALAEMNYDRKEYAEAYDYYGRLGDIAELNLKQKYHGNNFNSFNYAWGRIFNRYGLGGNKVEQKGR